MFRRLTYESLPIGCRFISLIVVGLLCCGCGKQNGPPPTPTFSVTGKVCYKDGDPLRKGIIQFISESNATLNMSAGIAEDGTFSLKTIQGNDSTSGAIEGDCKVIITPPFGGGIPKPILLNEIYHIKPQDNHFIIKLPISAPPK